MLGLDSAEVVFKDCCRVFVYLCGLFQFCEEEKGRKRDFPAYFYTIRVTRTIRRHMQARFIESLFILFCS